MRITLRAGGRNRLQPVAADGNGARDAAGRIGSRRTRPAAGQRRRVRSRPADRIYRVPMPRRCGSSAIGGDAPTRLPATAGASITAAASPAEKTCWRESARS